MELLVFYDGQFWVGIIKETRNGQALAASHVFGSSEPTDPMIHEFVCRELANLTLRPIADSTGAKAAHNPKRLIRQSKRQAAACAITGTKAQRQIQATMSAEKEKKLKVRRQNAADDAELRFRLKRQKQKSKRRGK